MDNADDNGRGSVEDDEEVGEEGCEGKVGGGSGGGAKKAGANKEADD